MDIKKWLKIQEQDAKNKLKNPDLYIDDDGTERDIKMSQAYADEYFFNLANSDLEKIIPKFCVDSAIYSLGFNCLIRLMLSGFNRDDIIKYVNDAVDVANDIMNEGNEDE